MTAQTLYCLDARARPKETFPSEHAARKAFQRKRNFRNRRYPSLYRCPCGQVHLTHGGER